MPISLPNGWAPRAAISAGCGTFIETAGRAVLQAFVFLVTQMTMAEVEELERPLRRERV